MPTKEEVISGLKFFGLLYLIGMAVLTFVGCIVWLAMHYTVALIMMVLVPFVGLVSYAIYREIF